MQTIITEILDVSVAIMIIIMTLAITLFAHLLFLVSTIYIVIHCYMDDLLKTLKNCKKYETELLDWSSKQIVENTPLLCWKKHTGYRYVSE